MSKGDLPGPRPVGGRSKGEGGGRPKELLMLELANSCCTRPLGMSKGDRPMLIMGPGPIIPPWPKEGIDGGIAGGAAEKAMGKSNGEAPERMPPLVSFLSMRSKGDSGQEGCACQLPACPLFCACSCCCCCCCCWWGETDASCTGSCIG